MLKDQQDLLKSLIDERMQSQKQFDLVMKRLDQLGMTDSSSASTLSKETDGTTGSGVTLINSGLSAQLPPPPPAPEYRSPGLPMCLHDRAEEIFDHCRLVNAVIDEVNRAQYKLNAGIRYRAQEKILESHYDEWSGEWQHHAGVAEHRYDYFEKHHHLKTYWKGRDNDNFRRNRTQPSLDFAQQQGTPHQTTPNVQSIAMRKALMAQQQAMLQSQLMKSQSGTPQQQQQQQQQQQHMQHIQRQQQQQQQQQLSAQKPATIPGQAPPYMPMQQMMQKQQAPPIAVLKPLNPAHTSPASPKLSSAGPSDYSPEINTPSRPRKRVASTRARSSTGKPAKTTSTSPLSHIRQTATAMAQNNTAAAADTTPSTTETPQDTSDAGPREEELFNLDFSTPENTDVLENFDFDSFLNKSKKEGLSIDSGIKGGDSDPEARMVDKKKRKRHASASPELQPPLEASMDHDSAMDTSYRLPSPSSIEDISYDERPVNERNDIDDLSDSKDAVFVEHADTSKTNSIGGRRGSEVPNDALYESYALKIDDDQATASNGTPKATQALSASGLVDPSLQPSAGITTSPVPSSEGTAPESASRRESTSSITRTEPMAFEGAILAPIGRVSKAKKGKKVHACTFEGCRKVSLDPN